MKILIAEDNQKIAEQLQQHLKNSGFVTKIESDGESIHFEGLEGGYDLILLDVGLPQMDGFSIIEKWRTSGVSTPVIMLTARDSKFEVIRGLDLGADDYITKPFNLDEVVARIRAQLKRKLGQTQNIITSGNVSLDVKSGRILLDGVYIKLTRIEFLLLQYLFLSRGKIVSAAKLAEHAYEDFDHDSSIIARHIANIRKKLGKDIIKTDGNRGYCVE